MELLQRTLSEANQVAELTSQLSPAGFWTQYCHMMGRSESLAQWFRLASFDFLTIDAAVDRMASTWMAPRGASVEERQGYIMSAENFGWVFKLGYVLST
eukprot:SAG22_NODE_4719_length_1182_cov_1.188366_2_plen_98_part_01